MSTMRIAHISDLHLSPFHKRVNIRRTRQLLEQVDRLGVDHVVLTGDITANAEPEDFQIARKLFQAHGLLDPHRMTVVVGNHDIFGGVHTPEEILEFPRRCRKTDVERKLEEFRVHFRELFMDSVFAPGNQLFPFIKPLRGLVLIGLNSVADYSPIKNPVGSNGKVGEKQRDRLDRMLTTSQFRHSRRIVLIHHHFNKMNHRTDGTMQSVWKAFEQQTMKLRGKRELMNLFRKHKVDAVLHGHYHENTGYVRKGLHFVNGGGSILGMRTSRIQLNLLHISERGIRLEHFEFPWSDESPSPQSMLADPQIIQSQIAA